MARAVIDATPRCPHSLIASAPAACSRPGRPLPARVPSTATGRAARHGIRGLPTLILFRADRELARRSGALGLQDLMQWVEQHV